MSRYDQPLDDLGVALPVSEVLSRSCFGQWEQTRFDLGQNYWLYKEERMDVPQDIAVAVKGRLGPIYDDLLEVMRDLVMDPTSMFGSGKPRIVEKRSRAASEINDWLCESPGDVTALYRMIPDMLQVPNVVQALLEAATWDDYFAIPESAFLFPDDGDRVLRAAPSLLNKIDDDGLLDITDIDAQPYGVIYGGFLLHYHQFLWRGFHGSVHVELIHNLLALARDGLVEARLAVDPHRLRYLNEYEEFIERDYWYRPPLDDGLLDDPNIVGTTVHGNPQVVSTLGGEVLATEVRWTNSGAGLKTIEIEELVTVDKSRQARVLCRYLHSIRDTNEKRFRHCDGAVKGYNAAEYPETLTDFSTNRAKAPYYRKAFRIDGPVPTNDWSQVVSRWFRGNRLVFEYLSGLGHKADCPTVDQT